MSRPKKSAWFETLFRLYNRNLLKRRFATLRVKNLQALSPQELPTIVYANHTSWWDGLVCFEIFKTAGADAHVLMEEANLRRYPLFARLGAIPIDREHPRRALTTINETAAFLRERTGRTLLVFPQGKIESAHTLPLRFESGISRLADGAAPCRILPLALSYEFRGEFKPDIFASIGTEMRFAGPETSRASETKLAESLESLLAEQRSFLAHESRGDYDSLL